MAQDDKPKRPTAQEFTTDPKFKEEKDSLWSYFDEYVKERSAQAKANKSKTSSALDFIFDPARIFSE